MVLRPFRFLVVFLLMFSGEILGQDTYVPRKFVKTSSKAKIGAERFKQNSEMYFCMSVPCDCLGQTRLPVKFSLRDFVSKNYFDDQLGIFCKKELQLEKLTSIPIRFRLGSLDYVNWMEGKPNAIKPN